MPFIRCTAPLLLMVLKIDFCQAQRSTNFFEIKESKLEFKNNNKSHTLRSYHEEHFLDATQSVPVVSSAPRVRSGSRHLPAVDSAVKTLAAVLLLSVSHLLSAVWPQSQQLNDTLLLLEQWGVKILSMVRKRIVL